MTARPIEELRAKMAPEVLTEAERLAANSRPTLIDIVDMIARQYQCSLKEASEYLAEAVKGLDAGNSRHTIGWQPIETALGEGMIEMLSKKSNPLIELYFVDEETIFVCGADGHITIGMLEEIEHDVLENGLLEFEQGPGSYLVRASYYEGQYGEYGACELRPGWELSFVAFEPIPEHAE